MELDFIITLGGQIAALEVKSGRDKSSASISKALSVFDIDNRIFFEEGNIQTDADGIHHYPLFASAFIDELDREA